MEAQENSNGTKGLERRNSIQHWFGRMVQFELAIQLNGECQSRRDGEKNEMVH